MERNSLMSVGVVIALAATLSVGMRSQPEDAFETRDFEVTAYCLKGITRSGIRVREGMVAADPRVLPLGSTIQIEDSGDWDGIYTVMDTGAAIRGFRLDLYLRDCREARELGRREARVTIIRRGWRPDATPDAEADAAETARTERP